MTTTLRRRIRHTRRWLGYGVLVLLILVALLVGVANQMLPLVERNPEKIAAWLSERVGEPVRFSHAHAEWTRRGPRFILDDLRVGDGAKTLNIGRAELLVAIYSGLLPDHPLTELKVRELSLTLVQDADRRWHVLGLPAQDQTQGDPLDRLQGFGELQIEKARLSVRSPQLKLDMALPRVDLRLRVDDKRLRAGASVWSNTLSAPMSVVLDMQRKRFDGVLWAGGDDLVLTHWAPLLAQVGLVPRDGQAQANLWAKLHDQRIDEVTLAADLQHLSLESMDPLPTSDGRLLPATASFDRLQTMARWSLIGGAWRLQIPELDVTQGKNTAHLGGLQAQVGERFVVQAKELDLSPLSALLSLSDRLPRSLRTFLAQSQPQAVLHEVSVQGRRNGQWHGSLRIDGLTLKPHGTKPGVSGLAGRVEFDERGGVLRLDSTPVKFEWPAGLRQTLDLKLAGTLALWRNGPGWTLGSEQLHIDGGDFAFDTRVQVGFQGDGSLPTLDLSAALAPSSFATAKKFWIMHKMPATTVKWLDQALVQGEVVNGRIAIGGDLDDWPFANHAGTFDARATIRNATVKFNEQWPAAQNMNLDLAFDGPGFTLEGTGDIQGNHVSHVSGGIASFHDSLLTLDIAATGSGEKLRELMIASPINDTYGEHLKAATIAGRAEVALRMDLPLGHDHSGKRIEGTVDLSDARLADSRWNLRFSRVSGRTRFSDHGFSADELKVHLDDQPGVFNLKVGAFVDDPRLAAQATLDGRFTAPTLIDRTDNLAWLKPWISGQSTWKARVDIPAGEKGKTAPPAQLHLATDLVGSALSLPAPLNKAADVALPLELQTPLPVEQGEVTLRLGELLRYRGVLRKDAPMLGSLQFGGGAAAPPRVAGLSVRGDVPLLDATGWIAFSSKGEGGAVLHDIDIQAKQLNLIDRAFADTHLQLDHGAANTQIRLKGTGIDGTIDISDDAARGVQGRFALLHLAAASTTTPGALPATIEVDDPAKLPPLRFSVADLRMGDAQLGQAELQTTPLPNGLRVDKFQTRARTLNLSAAGEWVRAERGTRSNFRLEFTANSLGQMLDALGFAGMVSGGKTRATLTGSWPGSPGAFSLATLSGSLKADVGEGRLLDVEPGGSGRILGLLSLAEIPRRLSLDFSDFFSKGFSFNEAKGDFVFNEGKARTDNLRIDGPAAEIRVSGTTGLRDQTYDQRVEVLPKAGGVLPAIGMLAGGPAGAAVGAMAQAVLQKPLKQTTRVVYHITGSWKEPKVVVTERGPPRAGSIVGDRGSPSGP
ncbi:YhdP family protein [Arenimonas oryziterrae]|uniref:YhdP central domain-containing protein n=1 Tax=Arenimonas oryziterrae DSM 21050 = YC6267 TaxID=1121015 RepID=A0A091AQX1_9GAMM|nr:YhdP family protein [Arenimonas oryziterrae]KFN41394.1 hypothetical protein N789_05830 [Arenimonas oryziterrae DSM 21050 = YC6267]